MKNRFGPVLLIITLFTLTSFGQSMSGPGTSVQGWPGNFSFCVSNAPGSKTWTTSSGSFVCMGCGPTYPVTSVTSTANCKSVELYFYHPFKKKNITVSASGSFGTVSASALIIPELHNQAIQSPQVLQHRCGDRRIFVQVTDSEWGDPSGLSRSGPNAFAQFPFKWLAKLPGSTNWTTIINEPGNTDQYPVPSTPLTTIGVKNGQLAGNPIVDSAIYATGEVILNLNSLPDSLDGTILKFQLENYQGHFLYSDSIVLSLEAPNAGSIINLSPLGSIIFPGATLSYSSNFDTIHSYQWFADGGVITAGQGTDSVTVQWGVPNQYANLTLVASRGGCSDSTILPIVITFLNNTEFSQSATLSVYPNPANEYLKVEVANELLGSPFYITDFLGNVLIVGVINNELTRLDLRTLNSGFYIFHVLKDGKLKSFKIQVN
jgi:hypothetical protein